jgi:hypothetical protein
MFPRDSSKAKRAIPAQAHVIRLGTTPEQAAIEGSPNAGSRVALDAWQRFHSDDTQAEN